MVRLNRIYTGSGDGGETGLGDGTRVPKIHARIEAYGTVDEVNACLGVCREQPGAESADIRLRHIQNDLFDLGADPGERTNLADSFPDQVAAHRAELAPPGRLAVRCRGGGAAGAAAGNPIALH